MYTVYLRTNTVNAMQYVGQTGDFKQRNRQWKCFKKSYANKYIDNDRATYGLESFTTQVLAEVETEEEALELEEHYINELNTLYPQGYNITVGGKKNNGAPKGENHPFYGKYHTEEAKHKMSEAKKSEKNPNYGKHRTDETKRKIGDTNTNGKCSKSVLQLDKVTGEVIRQWPSTMEIERQLGYKHSNISQCCKGKFEQRYGYKWQYA